MKRSDPIRIVQPTDVDGRVIFSDADHAKIHLGELFTSSYKNPDASPVADNANFDVLIITPADLSVNMTYEVTATGAYELAIYEDTTVTDNGTLLSRMNRNRILSHKKAKTLVYHTPTVTNVGLLLLNEASNGLLGGVNRGEKEWILKPSTRYLVRLINRAGSAQSMSTIVSWYEE